MNKHSIKCQILYMLLTISILFLFCPAESAKAETQGTWVKEGDDWCYEKSDGSRAKIEIVSIDGSKYYFDRYGHLLYGWFTYGTYLDRSGKTHQQWYYAGERGKIVTGWRKIKDNWYYFYLDGKMAADAIVDNGKAYVDENGVYKGDAGKWIQNNNGWWYECADSDRFWSLKEGKYVRYPSNDVVLINGKYYGFDRNGYMVKGWHDFGWSSNGKHVTAWFYFLPSGAGANGWLEIKGKWYYFENGYMFSNTYVDGHYLGPNGDMQLSVPSENQTKGRWKKNETGWWYEYSTGGYPKNTSVKINGAWFRFDTKGYMLTGWVKIGPLWYYYTSNGQAAVGWCQINGKTYYFAEDGRMYANTIVDGKYLDETGAVSSERPRYVTD